MERFRSSRAGAGNVVVDRGTTGAQRCVGACAQPGRKPRVHWGVDLTACSTCSGDLEIVTLRRRDSLGTFDRKKHADAVLRRAVGSIEEGVYVAPTKMTTGGFLDAWIEERRSQLRPTTWRSYRIALDTYVIPTIGGVLLQKLIAGHIATMEGDLLLKGGRDGKGLAPSTVRGVHAVLGRALRTAARRDLIVRNPMEKVDPPRVPRYQWTTWSAEQLRAFLDAIKGERFYSAYHLAAATGMRRGEVLGLRWQDSDLQTATLAIQQKLTSPGYGHLCFGEPKTKAGRRSIPLDPTTLAVLKEHRKVQAAEKLAWGPGWNDLGLVFTREDGSPVLPDRFSDRFEHLVAASGLPIVRLHDLRHGWASMALQGGVHPKIVHERLGHAGIAITLDTYSHVGEGLQREAADQVAALVFGASTSA